MQTNDSVLKKLGLPVLAIALLIVMVAWMAGAFNNKVKPGQSEQQSLVKLDELLRQAIEVERVKKEVFEPVPAGIEAKQNSLISSRILAKIEKVHVRAGQQVKQRQLLIELEKADLLSRESQAKAALSSVSARLLEAKNNLKRSEDLSQKGLIANAALEQTLANYDSLLAGKQSAEQALLEAQTALGYAQVHSPIDGLIIDRFAEPGNTAQPGMQLLTLYNPATLRVEAHVREQLAIGLSLGDTLQVSIPSMNKNLPSVIEEMVPAGNAASRSFLIKSRLEAEGLLPGMYAQLSVPVGTKQQILLPSDRIAYVGQLNVVWVLENEQVVRRFIRVGDQKENGMIEVVSGLRAGDLVLPVQS